MSSIGVSSQGDKIYMGDFASPNNYVAIPGVVSIDGPQSENPTIDVSDLDSTSKEYIGGLKDNGSLTLTCNFSPTNVVQRSVRAAQAANPPTTKMFVLEFNDTNPPTRYEFQGFVKSFKPKLGVDAKKEVDIEIQISGSITQYN